MSDENEAVKSWWSDNVPQIVAIDHDAQFIDIVNELAYDADQDALDVERMFNDTVKHLLMSGDASLCGKAVRAFVIEYLPVTVQVNPHATFAEVIAEVSNATCMYAVDVECKLNDLAQFILKNTNKVVGQ